MEPVDKLSLLTVMEKEHSMPELEWLMSIEISRSFQEDLIPTGASLSMSMDFWMDRSRE